jgi:hypothetical protein
MSTPLISAPEKARERSQSVQGAALSSPVLLYTLYWLIYDTFRQAFSSRIFWIMLVVSGV